MRLILSAYRDSQQEIRKKCHHLHHTIGTIPFRTLSIIEQLARRLLLLVTIESLLGLRSPTRTAIVAPNYGDKTKTKLEQMQLHPVMSQFAWTTPPTSEAAPE